MTDRKVLVPRKAFLLVILTALIPLRASAADIDWNKAGQQAAELLSAYVRIDTTNPPGNETAAAKFLAAHFEQAGIENQVLESAQGRGIVVARLQGSGEKRPVVLLSHLDVVPADPAGWKVPPFSGLIRDGYVWGRGAMDCKGVGSVNATAMIAMKHAGVKLERDVIFVGTGDEEVGGQLGAGWFAAHELGLLHNAEFLLNEGGAIRRRPDGSRVYEVAVSEKIPCWLRVTATGEGGHGAAPQPETAVTRLVAALDRIHHYQPEIRVVPEVEAYYAALAGMIDGPRRERYRDLKAALEDASFRRQFLSDRHDAALVRDTVAPTVLKGSSKTNVIPRSASAELDCRLLPDEDPDAFIRALQRVVKDDDVHFEKLLSFPPSSSPADTALYRAIQRVAESERTRVIPSVLTGFTDSHYFRDHGITSYGFTPFVFTEEDEGLEHGINERLSLDNLRDGTRRLVEILQALDQES